MSDLWMGVRGLFYGGKERGQTLVEYALIIALIALVIFVAVEHLGTYLDDFFRSLANVLNGLPT